MLLAIMDSGLGIALGGGHGGSLDGAIGALMPGNAGGAKGPDFWCAFEDVEVVVIGDEPANTINDRRRRRKSTLREGPLAEQFPSRKRYPLGAAVGPFARTCRRS